MKITLKNACLVIGSLLLCCSGQQDVNHVDVLGNPSNQSPNFGAPPANQSSSGNQSTAASPDTFFDSLTTYQGDSLTLLGALLRVDNIVGVIPLNKDTVDSQSLTVYSLTRTFPDPVDSPTVFEWTIVDQAQPAVKLEVMALKSASNNPLMPYFNFFLILKQIT